MEEQTYDNTSFAEKFNNLIKDVESKSTWNTKELLVKLNTVKQNVGHTLKDVVDFIPSPKKITVEEIKKYDVLYLTLFGLPHYFLVHKVFENQVYGVIFSSKERLHSIHQIEKDRFFKNNYATSTYLIVDINEAYPNFVRVYESKPEADLIFNLVKEFYSKNLNTKR